VCVPPQMTRDGIHTIPYGRLCWLVDMSKAVYVQFLSMHAHNTYVDVQMYRYGPTLVQAISAEVVFVPVIVQICMRIVCVYVCMYVCLCA
jgi:hypothetical protein